MADVVGVFGIRGELKIRSDGMAPLAAGLTVVLRGKGRTVTTRVLSARPHKRLYVVKLQGIDDPDAASAWRGAAIVIPDGGAQPLPPLTYRHADLIGMRVVDQSLGMLGDVRSVRHYPHCDMLIVGDGALPVPLLQAFAVQVDIPAREIRTALPPGFEDLTRP
ncbi:MAG: ribosome maturation factor RimM [Candidatus Eremiobacteraeota bacterium]|nr:ribosome maturation factor RimM [Candidatus Eremiobacteraeota bacterium]